MSDLPPIPDAEKLTLLHRDGQFGDLYEAEFRTGDEEGGRVTRIVHVVRLGELGSDQRKKVLDDVRSRVSKLLKNPLPHVSPIYKAGILPTGDYYIVRARHTARLLDEIPDFLVHPLAKANLDSLVAQLLAALAALHRLGIFYGDLRLEDIQIDGNGNGNCRTLWIAGAEFGGLSSWSRSHILRASNGQLVVFPPESPTAPPEPSAKTDLYFLGLLICQIAGGRKAIDAGTTTDKARHIQSRAVRTLVEDHLLAQEPDDRPVNAHAALKKLRSLKFWQFWQGYLRPTLWGAAVLVGALLTTILLALYLWHVAAKNREIARLENENRIKQTELDAKDREIAFLVRTAPKSLPSDTGPDDKLEREAAIYFNRIAKDAVKPNDAEIWLEGEMKGRPDAERAKIVSIFRPWMKPFVSNSAYTLSVDAAVTDQNQGENWRLIVYVNGTEADRVYFTKGVQVAKKRPTLTFNWKAGDTVRIILEGDWFVLDPTRDNLIDKEYSGPYVPWEMHKDGQGLQPNGTTLQFEISPSPGPPREWFKPIS